MNVVIYSHSFAPKVGGAETYVMLLAQGLAQRSQQAAEHDLQVTVVTPTAADEWDDAALPFRVIRQPHFVRVVRLLWNADVIHLVGPCFVPMLIGLASQRPLVVEHHGYQAICPNGLLFYSPTKKVCPDYFMAGQYRQCLRCNTVEVGWLKGMSLLLATFPRRWMCRLVKRNIPISYHLANRLRLPRCQVIYYGIEDSFAAGGGPLSLSQELVCFAYVGRLVREKGLPVLAEAARQLKDQGYQFRLKFIGDGPERRRLEELIDSLSLREEVTFTGFLQGNALQTALENVHAVVMPTLMEETAGLAVIEHMMRGRLVLASDIGGMGEVVNGAGLKFPAGHVQALASCMRRALQEPNLARVLGEIARQRALQLFLEQRMVAHHLAVYRELTKK